MSCLRRLSYYYFAISSRAARIFGCGSAASFNPEPTATAMVRGVLRLASCEYELAGAFLTI
jgi:hypothetical protein